MATSFPTSLDALTNPISTNALNSPSHADQHANANDAIEAVQTVIGTTAAPGLLRTANPTFTGTIGGGIVVALTDTGAGRGVGILAPASGTAGILQFMNNAGSAQWSSISSTNNTINLNASVTNTTGLNNSGTINSYTGTTSISLGGWSSSGSYSAVQGNKGYLLLGNTIGDSQIYLRTDSGAVNIGAAGSNTLVVGNGSTTANGNLFATGYLAVGGTGITDANSISCSGWFRTTGNTGIYFATHAGGWYMSDGTWMRMYNDKNLYTGGTIRVGYTMSGNAGRVRGSYGSISFDSNGATGGWDGIEFTGSPQTYMVLGDYHSGMYRNNNTWNWLWNYSSLIVGSDERYKRDIQPLGLGMKFVEHLEPISYLKLTESTDDDSEATEPGYYYGFSAQNVRAALDACGETRDVKIHDIGGPNMGLVACVEGAVYDRQFIGISEFMAPVVEAIKELNERVKTLEGV